MKDLQQTGIRELFGQRAKEFVVENIWLWGWRQTNRKQVTEKGMPKWKQISL